MGIFDGGGLVCVAFFFECVWDFGVIGDWRLVLD